MIKIASKSEIPEGQKKVIEIKEKRILLTNYKGKIYAISANCCHAGAPLEDGILEGDFVVVEETNEARDGDIVVAMVNNGVVTLKRYFKESDRVRLEPANSALQPIYAKNVTIQGRCVGVIRKYN